MKYLVPKAFSPLLTYVTLKLLLWGFHFGSMQAAPNVGVATLSATHQLSASTRSHNQLVKSARLASYSLSCPPEASIHPCTCVHHTSGAQIESEEEEEEIYEISPAITTPYAEPIVMTTTQSVTLSSTTTTTTAPATTTEKPYASASMEPTATATSSSTHVPPTTELPNTTTATSTPTTTAKPATGESLDLAATTVTTAAPTTTTSAPTTQANQTTHEAIASAPPPGALTAGASLPEVSGGLASSAKAGEHSTRAPTSAAEQPVSTTPVPATIGASTTETTPEAGATRPTGIQAANVTTATAESSTTTTSMTTTTSVPPTTLAVNSSDILPPSLAAANVTEDESPVRNVNQTLAEERPLAGVGATGALQMTSIESTPSSTTWSPAASSTVTTVSPTAASTANKSLDMSEAASTTPCTMTVAAATSRPTIESKPPTNVQPTSRVDQIDSSTMTELGSTGAATSMAPTQTTATSAPPSTTMKISPDHENSTPSITTAPTPSPSTTPPTPTTAEPATSATFATSAPTTQATTAASQPVPVHKATIPTSSVTLDQQTSTTTTTTTTTAPVPTVTAAAAALVTTPAALVPTTTPTTQKPTTPTTTPKPLVAAAPTATVLKPMVGSPTARRSTIKPNRANGARVNGHHQSGGHSRQPRSTTLKIQRVPLPNSPRVAAAAAARGSRRPRRYLAPNGQHLDPFGGDQSEPKVEIVAYCRNIQNPQVLRSAIKGFRGHQVNYFIIDSCKVPPFPNDLFQGVDVRWLEMSNSTVQFHNNFLHGGHHHTKRR